MTAAETKVLVQQFFDALNAGDAETIANSYTPDGSIQTMGNTLISGVFNREQILQSAAGIFDVFPKGLTFTVLGMVAEGNKVAVEATSEGEHVSANRFDLSRICRLHLLQYAPTKLLYYYYYFLHQIQLLSFHPS